MTVAVCAGVAFLRLLERALRGCSLIRGGLRGVDAGAERRDVTELSDQAERGQGAEQREEDGGRGDRRADPERRTPATPREGVRTGGATRAMPEGAARLAPRADLPRGRRF